MDLELSGKHVLVTGGSKGIGFATASCFAREGAHVTIVSRDERTLRSASGRLKQQTGTAVDYLAADLAIESEREKLFLERPDVDVLINNAGAIKAGGLDDLTMDEWRTGWELKVFGYIHLCKLYVPRMQEREHGTVINIIGMGGRAVRPSYICGAAGNAALIGFTNALGADTPRHNVRVFGINPSQTLTGRMEDMLKTRAQKELGDGRRWSELLDNARFQFGRPKNPEEVAALATMLASPRVHYLSETVIDLDGGGQWAD